MINEGKFAETYIHFDRETVVEIIDIFIEEYDERIEKISQHLAAKNPVELQKHTHAFKGVISNFETECKAYDNISQMDSDLRDFNDVKSRDTSVDGSEEDFYKKLRVLFDAFRKDSRIMHTQLMSIRKNYLD
jgi:hypothetical protein